jgi:hypothetical protein
MANQYDFDDDDLLLSADKVEQFTLALATDEVADPLQELCDEAAAIVARMTTGYVVDNNSVFSFIRAIAVFNAYLNSGTPAPEDVTKRYASNMGELEAIAGGKRPNLPKTTVAAQQSISGAIGSERKIHGRMGHP